MKTTARSNESKRGFTIVELVIVIAVIAILAAVLIPTFSGIINKANLSKASSQALNAYKALTYGSDTGAIRDGFVFISGDYAFANVEQNIHQLELVGTNTVSNSEDDIFFIFMLGDITYEGSKTGAGAYELKNGDYDVYKLVDPEGHGTYYFWVQPRTESAAGFQQAGLEWVQDADTYAAAMILTTESEDTIVSRYKIKTVESPAENGVMYSNDTFYAPLCAVVCFYGNMNVDFSQVDMINVELAGSDMVETASFNGHGLLSSPVESFTVSAAQVRSYYTDTSSNHNVLFINE